MNWQKVFKESLPALKGTRENAQTWLLENMRGLGQCHGLITVLLFSTFCAVCRNNSVPCRCSYLQWQFFFCACDTSPGFLSNLSLKILYFGAHNQRWLQWCSDYGAEKSQLIFASLKSTFGKDSSCFKYQDHSWKQSWDLHSQEQKLKRPLGPWRSN